MRRPFENWPVFVAGVFLAVWLGGTGQATQTVAELKIAVNADIRSLNPGVKRDAITDIVHHHLYEGLVEHTETLDVAPSLAETIRISKDRLDYHFTLRKGVLFHNGDELTADHVKWNWDRMLDPMTRWRCTSWFDGSQDYSAHIVSIETHGRYDVVFKLARPSFTFLHRMANVQCFSAIVHPSSVDADGDISTPIGTGPYRLDEWRRGDYVRLQKFINYSHADKAANGFVGKKEQLADALKFMVIADMAVAKSAMLAGDIDWAKVPITLYPELRGADAIGKHVEPLLNWVVLLVQTEDPVVGNLKIRQAIAHAINREKLAEYATLGFGEPNSSAIPVKSPYYGPAHKDWYAYDPSRARALLKEAGYDGTPIRIQTTRKYEHLYDNAIIVHSMLRDVGMNAELEVLDWASQLNNFYSGNFQLSSFDFSARNEPYLNYLIIVGPKSLNPANQWDSDAALALLGQTEEAETAKGRRQIFRHLHKLLKSEIPILGLYNTQNLLLTSARMEGYKGWTVGLPRFWRVNDSQRSGEAR